MASQLLQDDRSLLQKLAEVACSAAEELDERHRGHLSDLESVKKLDAFLDEIYCGVRSDATRPVASMRLTLVRRAMVGPEEQVGLASAEDVISRAIEIMRQTDPASEKGDELLDMRDFCLALSKVAAAEGRLRGRQTPTMRYRK